jgi:hypothetical protein
MNTNISGHWSDFISVESLAFFNLQFISEFLSIVRNITNILTLPDFGNYLCKLQESENSCDMIL